jgi:hypothetical protein
LRQEEELASRISSMNQTERAQGPSSKMTMPTASALEGSSQIKAPTPQIYRHYNKIEIFNEDKLAQNQSLSDTRKASQHQKSSHL